MSEAVKTYEDIKDVQLEDIVIPTNLMESKEYPSDEIYELQVNGQVYAPIWAYDLKDYLEHHEVANDTQIKILGSEDWKSIFEHPMFQRRRPQIVSSDDDLNPSDSYHLLKNGKKIGPYTIAEITNMIDQKEILFTDMVCNEEQTEWTPIFKVNNFDRRNLKSIGELPGRPTAEVESLSIREVVSTLENKDIEKEGALADLAFIGNLKSAKNKSLSPEEKQEISFQDDSDEMVSTTGEVNNTIDKKYIVIGVIIALILGALLLRGNSDPKKVKAKSKVSKVSKKKVKAKSKAKLIKAKVIKARPVIKRRPAARRKKATIKKKTSFRNTAQKYQYKKAEVSNLNNADQNYDSISDNIAPEELEPSEEITTSELEEEELFDAEAEL